MPDLGDLASESSAGKQICSATARIKEVNLLGDSNTVLSSLSEMQVFGLDNSEIRYPIYPQTCYLLQLSFRGANQPAKTVIPTACC